MTPIPPPLAGIDDLAARLGQEVPNEEQAAARLRDASAIVRAFGGKTWLNDAGDELVDVPDSIVGVTATMVERAVRNPTGSTQATTGPFSVSFGSDAAQRLYLTANDKLVISDAAGLSRSGIAVISTTRGPLETPAVHDPYWLDLDDYC